MLDVLGILISTTAALLVVWRAARLDELYPWFDDVSASEAGAEPGDDGRRTGGALGGQRQLR